jgi:hypothetical protein
MGLLLELVNASFNPTGGSMVCSADVTRPTQSPWTGLAGKLVKNRRHHN